LISSFPFLLFLRLFFITYKQSLITKKGKKFRRRRRRCRSRSRQRPRSWFPINQNTPQSQIPKFKASQHLAIVIMKLLPSSIIPNFLGTQKRRIVYLYVRSFRFPRVETKQGRKEGRVVRGHRSAFRIGIDQSRVLHQISQSASKKQKKNKNKKRNE